METDNVFKMIFHELPSEDAGLDPVDHSLGGEIFLEKSELPDPVKELIDGKSATALRKSAPAGGTRLDRCFAALEKTFAGHPTECAEAKRLIVDTLSAELSNVTKTAVLEK
jgi:hypothetical protein